MIEITPQQLWALEDIGDSANPVATALAIADAIRKNNTDIPRRWILSVRYKPVRGLPAPYVNQVTDYPAFETFVLKYERAISKQDVLDAIQARESSVVDVQVTPDPRSLRGWTQLDVYSF